MATSALQKETVDICLTLNPHHDLRGDNNHTRQTKSIPDAPVPPGIPTIRLNSITVDLGLSAWPFEPSNPPSSTGHYSARNKSLPGLAITVTLLDASLRRLLFGHSASKDVVEAKGAETSSLSQLAPSILRPDFRKVSPIRTGSIEMENFTNEA